MAFNKESFQWKTDRPFRDENEDKFMAISSSPALCADVNSLLDVSPGETMETGLCAVSQLTTYRHIHRINRFERTRRFPETVYYTTSPRPAPSDSRGRSGTTGRNVKAATDDRSSKGIQPTIIMTETMLPIVETASRNTSITVGIFNAHNNYTMPRDLEAGLRDISTSAWVCIKPGISDTFREKVLELSAERRKFLPGKLGLLLDLRLLLVDGMNRKEIHASLRNIQFLEVRDNNQELLDATVKILLNKQRDSLMKVESVIRDKTKSDMFWTMYLHITVPQTESREEQDPLLRGILDNIETKMADTTTAIRQHFQKHFKTPHLKLQIEEKASNKAVCSLQLRLYDSNAAKALLTALKDGTIQTVFRQHIPRDDDPLECEVTVRGDLDELDSVIKTITAEEKKDEVRILQKFLVADGGGTAVFMEGNPKAESSPVSKEQKEALRVSQMSSVVMDLVEQYMKDRKRTPYEFIQLVSKTFPKPEDWIMLRNSTDYNIMHLAVLNGRHDFLELFFYKGVWGLFRQDVGRPVGDSIPNAHLGYTARRVAESYAYKDLGQETLILCDKLDDLWDRATPLMLACLQSDSSVVKALVKLDTVSLNVVDDEGSTCLFYACGRGDSEIVKFLLSEGADPDHRNKDGHTCIIKAAMYGYVHVLEVLSVVSTVQSFHNAVDYCALNGHKEGLQFFHKKKIVRSGERILTLAAKNKQSRVLAYILEQSDSEAYGKKIDLESANSKDEMDRTAICHAVLNADLVSFRLLLSKDADLNIRDLHKNTILHLAVESGSLEMVNLVLSRLDATEKVLNERNIYAGQDTLYTVRGKDQGRRAWHWVELNRFLLYKFRESLKSGQVDVVKFGVLRRSGYGAIEDDDTKQLMDNFVKMKIAESQPDMSPLHLALSKNHTAIAKVLLEKGANPNERDCFQATPLHYACMFGNIEILEVLEKFQVDFEARNVDNKTPIEVAELNGQVMAVNFLEARVSLNKTQNFMASLQKAQAMLMEDTLDERRRKGRNVRRFMVDTLRDLNIDVNVMLQELGSGPVLENTSSS